MVLKPAGDVIEGSVGELGRPLVVRELQRVISSSAGLEVCRNLNLNRDAAVYTEQLLLNFKPKL